MLYTHAFLFINLRTIYVYKLYIYPVNRYMVYTCIYIGKRINVISLIVIGHAKFIGFNANFRYISSISWRSVFFLVNVPGDTVGKYQLHITDKICHLKSIESTSL